MPSFSIVAGNADKYIPNQNPWRFGWPNSADMNFNFYKLMDDARPTSIGKATGTPPKIAIIGAGVAAGLRIMTYSLLTRLPALSAAFISLVRLIPLKVAGQNPQCVRLLMLLSILSRTQPASF